MQAENVDMSEAENPITEKLEGGSQAMNAANGLNAWDTYIKG